MSIRQRLHAPHLFVSTVRSRSANLRELLDDVENNLLDKLQTITIYVCVLLSLDTNNNLSFKTNKIHVSTRMMTECVR